MFFYALIIFTFAEKIFVMKHIFIVNNDAGEKSCLDIVKEGIAKCDVTIDYVALDIPPAFIVGYGLDYDDLGRNLKDIYTIVQE